MTSEHSSPRIAVVTTVHRWGDPRIFERQVASYLEWGCEVHVFVPPSEPERQGWSTSRSLHFHPLPERAGRLGRALLSLGAWRAVAGEGDFDVVHFHDPELIPAMSFLAALRPRSYFLYDIHEELPLEVESKPYIHPLLRRPAAMLAEGLWGVARISFEGFAPATEAIALHWPAADTRVVHNYPKSVYADADAGESVPDPDRLLFIGGLAEVRGIREMLEAVRELRRTRPALRVDLVGPVVDDTLAEPVRAAIEEGVCTHTPWLAPEQLVPFSRGAGIGLIPYLPVSNYLESLPTKMFEYMAMGIPVLASDFPLWRDLVRDAGCGRVVPPRPAELARAIGEMLASPEELARLGASGREAYRRGYRWETERASLRWHLDRALAWRKARGSGTST